MAQHPTKGSATPSRRLATFNLIASMHLLPMQISLVRKRLQALGADTRLMGTFCENHDSDRFLSARCDFGAGVRAWVAMLSPSRRLERRAALAAAMHAGCWCITF